MTSPCITPGQHVLDKDGYPRIKHNKRLWRLNRLQWTICFGEIPAGMVVAHKCNNKGCINPEHLYLASPEQNSTDAASQGLYRVGDRHPKVKRSNQDCLDMWEQYHTLGHSQTEISKLYGISQSRVSECIRRATKIKETTDD